MHEKYHVMSSKCYHRLWVVVVLYFLSVFAGPAEAQWQLMKSGLLTLDQSFDGAIAYCAGRVYATSQNTVMESPDDGATWVTHTVNFPLAAAKTLDVDFYDSLNGVVLSHYFGPYITRNGGVSWTAANLPDSFWTQAKFVSSPFVIAATTGAGIVWVTQDGGTTWNRIVPPYNGDLTNLLVRHANHTIYIIKLNGSTGSRVLWSSDYGLTWTTSAGGYTYDCYSFALDSCNWGQFNIVNEGTAAPESDLRSRLHYSFDNGLTFPQVAYSDITYYTGCVTNSLGGTLYVQTTPETLDGLLRSLDHGRTWKKIGGPSGIIDAHLTCTKNDNTVFAVDANGNCWRTTNSGNDSIIRVPNAGTLSPSVASLFDGDTVVDCSDSIVRTLTCGYTGCLPVKLKSVSVYGQNAASYGVWLATSDSVVVTLTPTGVHGQLPATLLLTADDGSTQLVSLNGNGRGVPFICTASPASITDSLTLCDSPVTHRVIFSVKGCFMPHIVSQRIIGSGNYTLVTPAPDSLGVADYAEIEFRPSSSGAGNATYEVVFSDSTILRISLNSFTTPGGYTRTYSPAALTDSLTLCDTALTRVFRFHAGGCRVPKIVSQQIVGAQPGDYTLVQPVPDSIGVLDSAVVRFTLHGLGLRSATYEIVFDDGSKISIPLNGFGVANSFGAQASPSVVRDTIRICDPPLDRTIYLTGNGCPQPHIILQQLSGDPSYRLIQTMQDSVGDLDSLVVRFTPTQGGLARGAIVLTFSDGTLVTIPLEDVAVEIPFTSSIAPSVAFAKDTLFPCDSPIVQRFAVVATGCPSARVVSQSIVGPASADYTLLQGVADSIAVQDSALIRFSPTGGGARDANYVIQFSNGVALVVPLQGVGGSPQVLTLSTTDQSVGVLGSTIHVPLTLSGLTTSQTIEAVLHYDVTADLDYLGSYAASGTSVDLASESWPGRAKLRIQGATSGTICTADFNVFADTIMTPRVWFDSVSVVGTFVPCAFTVADSARAAVSIIGGCGVGIVSRFLHHQVLPQFTVRPNPATNIVELHSTSNGYVVIDVVDGLGSIRSRNEGIVGTDAPLILDIGDLPSANYFVRIANGSAVVVLPLVIVR